MNLSSIFTGIFRQWTTTIATLLKPDTHLKQGKQVWVSRDRYGGSLCTARCGHSLLKLDTHPN